MRARTRTATVVVLAAVVVAACGGAARDLEEGDDVDGAAAAVGAEVGAEEVAYGDGPDQVADLAVPDGDPPTAGWPTVVLVHGGFWREPYRRELMTPLAADLVARGYATWNLEYGRVGGAGGWPTTLAHVGAGIDHLAVLVGDGVPLDLDRVAVVGHSAGGHLALWAAGRGRLPAGTPGTSPVVVPCAAVGQAPVADLVAGADLGGGAVREMLGGGPEQVPERYAAADPAQLVGHGVPVLLVHGEADDIVPPDQSQRYATAATTAGDEVVEVVLPGDHFTVIDPGSEPWAAVVGFLDDTC